jgi:hypothetical protein
MAKSKSKRHKSARDKRVARVRETRAARRRVVEEAESQRRLDELFSEDEPVERSAELVLERLGDGPVPAGITRFFALAGSEARARAVAAEVARLRPQSAAELTLAADVALHLDGDARTASALLDRAAAIVDEDDGRTALAAHLLGLGRVADALALVEDLLLEAPDDEDAQGVRADALALAHRRLRPAAVEDDPAPEGCPCWSGRSWADCCRRAEERALERFVDRDRLYGLRRAVLRFTATTPRVADEIARHVAQWLEDAGADSHEEARDALIGMAAEHAWIVGDEDSDDNAHAPFDLDSPLALFAADAATPASRAAMARRWLEHCEYGLWQVADPTPAPGIWLTEIVTGRRRYAAIPAEQLEQAARWTVLLGALVAIDGTWRTTSAVIPLRPSEGDELAGLAEEMMYAVVSAMSGRRIEPERRGKAAPGPHGVLVAQTEPAPPEVADLLGKVVGSGLPRLVSLRHEMRDAAPRLVNTDRDPLCLVKATVGVADPVGAAQRLADHPDVERDADALVWWGRELDDMERETSLAELRAHLRAQGEDVDVAEPHGPRRWLRGRVELADGGFDVDVNSKERFERFLDLLRELGEEPTVSDKLVIDPAQDLPQLRSGSMIPFAASEEANAAWVEHWPDQQLPALAGRTPRAAARRPADQPRLEALLRELQHDADLLANRGLPAPDVGRLRKELQMPADAWQ